MFQRNIKRAIDHTEETLYWRQIFTNSFSRQCCTTMDFFDARYYRINKLLLSFVGLWPFQTFFIKILIFPFVTYGFMILLVPQIAYLFKHMDNLDNMFEVMPILSGTFITCGKGIGLILSSVKFKTLLQQIREHWDNLLNSQETYILMRYSEIGRKLTLICTIGTYIGVNCYVVLPLYAPLLDIILPLNETRLKRLPHAAEYFVDEDKYYYVLLLNTYVGYMICITIVIAADTTYLSMVTHVCGMYDVLRYRLENLVTMHDELRGINYDCIHRHNEIKQRIRSCIQLHEKIKIFIDIMTSTFMICLLFDIGLGFVMLTSVCIMTVVRMGRLSEIVRYIVVALLQNCRLFINNWAGQEVIDHSSSISVAAYSGIWYDAPVEVQKSLILLIARSQKACRLTIAKLYIISLEAFSTAMKTCVSYCTVMISLRET